MSKYKLSIFVILAVFAVANMASAQVVGFMSTQKAVSARTYLSVDKLRPGDDFQIAVQATVKKGYHIGAHAKDALYPAKLNFAAPKAVKLDAPTYPDAKRKSFAIAPDKKLPIYEGTFTVIAKGHVARDAKPGPITITATLDTQACKDAQCFPPELTKTSVKTAIVARGAAVKQINHDVFAPATTVKGGLENKLAQMPLVLRLLMLYGLGLLLAFTPCVYPMVPVTVGYFSAQGESRTRKVVLLAAMYVLGLALTYSTLGAVAATTGKMFGTAMQSPAVLLGIAAVLVALALSMFGLYELQAPAFIQNKASGKSGVLGALFMGLVFGIVCAPCVGPVVLGLMAFVAHLGSPLMGFGLFFALSLGIGTPLFLLAAFSAKLPVPGMWMVAVKKAAGFLLVGAAAYFLTPMLPDVIARYLLPVVIITGGIYIGFFEKSIRASRIGSSCGRVTGTAALVLAVMMATPHMKTQSLKWQPYSPAAAVAGKPVMIDFTAKWCGACQELEHGPFSDQKVIKAAARFQHLRVDGTDRNDRKMLEAAKHFKVQGFPTVIFLDSSGNEVASARIVGYVDSRDMLKRIDSVK